MAASVPAENIGKSTSGKALDIYEQLALSRIWSLATMALYTEILPDRDNPCQIRWIEGVRV
jgi:hypothetical protein